MGLKVKNESIEIIFAKIRNTKSGGVGLLEFLKAIQLISQELYSGKDMVSSLTSIVKDYNLQKYTSIPVSDEEIVSELFENVDIFTS